LKKLLYKILALLVGGLFIFSGLVKVNDPVGTAIKLEEYFDVFSYDISGFFHLFIPLALGIAFFITILEVVLGVALIVSFFRKATLYTLLAMILFFTFLTFYSAYFNKVTDCGCFGDAIKLTPWQSFYKDIILLVAIAILVWLEPKIKWPRYRQTQGIVFVILALIVATGIAWSAVRYLPPVDFRVYKNGNNIVELSRGQEPCRYVYVMEKEGETVTFQNYPSEPGYKLVEMLPVNEALCMPKISDFAVLNPNGDDFTHEVLSGRKALLIIHDLSKADKDGIKDLVDVLKNSQGIDKLVLTSSAEGIEKAQTELLNNLPYYYVDATVLKTMIRSNPGLIYLNDGVVIDKWHYNSASSIHFK
jgi:uncharacterized membrane protein YphA (DoxX/SURF4 family)